MLLSFLVALIATALTASAYMHGQIPGWLVELIAIVVGSAVASRLAVLYRRMTRKRSDSFRLASALTMGGLAFACLIGVFIVPISAPNTTTITPTSMLDIGDGNRLAVYSYGPKTVPSGESPIVFLVDGPGGSIDQ